MLGERLGRRHASLEQVIYAEDSMVLIVREDHPRIQSEPDLESILQEQFVICHDLFTRYADHAVSNLFESARQRAALEVPHALLLPHVVTRTDLLSMVVRSMAESYDEEFPIRHFPLPIQMPRNRSYMIWHQALSQDPGHKWLREQVMAVGEDLGVRHGVGREPH